MDPIQMLSETQRALSETKKVQARILLDGRLAASKLPTPAAGLVRASMESRINNGAEVTEAIIDADIKRTRDAFAAMSQTGRLSSAGVHVALDGADKVQLALDGMLGVKESLNKGVPAFRGPRQAYAHLTGDTDLTFAGAGLYRTSLAIGTADFPNLLLNSMTKRLLQDYAELGMGGLDQVYVVGPALGDYKTQDRVRLGYLGDLPTVAEAAPYTELTKPTDEKISFAVTKRGGLLTVSEETIRNDDLGKLTQFPQRLARAGRRTLKQYITDFFLNNPNYDPDSVAWFHATHQNLTTLPLSSANLTTCELSLMKQAEKDSTKRLGLRMAWIMVPVDLYATAWQINNNNDGANMWYGRFGTNSERIIVNELLSDTNDWFFGASTVDAPCLEIGFLDGIQQPQILMASIPNAGLNFTNDQIVYKAKFVFGGDIIDFRGVGKNAVP